MTDKHQQPPNISRADVEKAIWSMTGWQGDQVVVDGLLTVIDTYAAGIAEALQRTPVLADSWYHSLVTMAHQILDTGGQMRLVPPEAETVLRAGDVGALASALAETVLARMENKPPSLTEQAVAAHISDMEKLLNDPDLVAAVEQLSPAPYSPYGRDPRSTQITSEDAAKLDTRMLRCTKCSAREGREVRKPVSAFAKDATSTTGVKSQCKECEAAYRRERKKAG